MAENLHKPAFGRSNSAKIGKTDSNTNERKKALKNASNKKCLFCHINFKPTNPRQKYHSPNCRKRAWDRKKFLEILLEFINRSKDVKIAIEEFMERTGKTKKRLGLPAILEKENP